MGPLVNASGLIHASMVRLLVLGVSMLVLGVSMLVLDLIGLLNIQEPGRFTGFLKPLS